MKLGKSVLAAVLAAALLAAVLPAAPVLAAGDSGAPAVDAVSSATMISTPKDGDEVVIYYEPSNEVLSVNASGGGLAGAAATVNNSITITVKTAEAAIFTVAVVDGACRFETADGKYLTAGAAGGTLTLADSAAPESLWLPEQCDSGYYLKNAGAAAQYLGRADGGFTTLAFRADDPYTYSFQFYRVRPMEEHVHEYMVYATTAATCFSAGSVTYRCIGCGDTYTEEIAPSSDHCPSKAFADVDPSRWYHEGIDYALTHGLMLGMSQSEFGAELLTTRGQLVTILYRMAGRRASGQTAAFSDTEAGRYYSAAVQWAAENGIVSGYEDGTFRPGDAVTREQLAAILYRYTAYRTGESPAAAGSLQQFADAGQVHAYAETAMCWAVGEGLITGTDAATLDARGGTTRAQAAVILMRYLVPDAD